MKTIREEVNQIEENNGQKPWKLAEGKRLVGIVAGAAVFAVGVNLFLRPLQLYSGGFMGFAQLITYLLRNVFKINTGSIDLSGIIYYAFNLPTLIIAWRTMRRRFVFKTIFAVTSITILLTLVPIPSTPVLDERIANCLVAGIMAGFGVGVILRMGACDGGMDLIGVLLLQQNKPVSVGKVTALSNLVLYGICLFLFDIPTVIYSLLYSVVNSMMCDRIHVQNINVQALIVTKLEDIRPLEIALMGQLKRGLTHWDATGAYTGSDEHILMIVINKYEITHLRTIVHEIDPHAFVMINEGISINGNFLKKLT